MPYTFGTELPGDVAGVKRGVVAALADEGFGVLTEIDVAATMKAKLGIDRDPYLILGACNPSLANAAIDADADVGALLPCNVVLRQVGGTVLIRFMDPQSVLGLVDSSDIGQAAAEARQRLERVCAALTSA